MREDDVRSALIRFAGRVAKRAVVQGTPVSGPLPQAARRLREAAHDDRADAWELCRRILDVLLALPEDDPDAIHRDLLRRAGGHLEEELAADWLGMDVETLRRHAGKGDILAVEVDGRLVVPAFQLRNAMTTLRVREILAVMPIGSAWMRLKWFLTPSDALGGVTPLDALRDDRVPEVRDLARSAPMPRRRIRHDGPPTRLRRYPMNPITVSPLAPLGLAVSLWLNQPEELLAMLRAIPERWVTDGDRDLFEKAMRAASAITHASILFDEAQGALRAVADPRFTSEAKATAGALMEVLAEPWPGVTDGDRRLAEAAYCDVAVALEAMAEGIAPLPDEPCFLANLMAGIRSIPGQRTEWTFETLPDFT